MVRFCVFLSLALTLSQCTAQNVITRPECDIHGSEGRSFKLFVNSKKNEDDEWVTTFSAFKNSTGSSSDDITLDLDQSVIDCQGNQLIHIQGILKENSSKRHKNPLLFHEKCSSDAAVTNNGRTLQKIKLDGRGAALTNRPLVDNEIFQVRLDKKTTTFNYAIGIGVTTHVPGTFEVPNHMNTDKIEYHPIMCKRASVCATGIWMLYHSNIYQGGPELRNGYLKIDLNTLQVGSRIGVMRSTSGALHFYINGVDQGPAVSNIPSPVYGVFELFGDAAQVTILDPVSPYA